VSIISAQLLSLQIKEDKCFLIDNDRKKEFEINQTIYFLLICFENVTLIESAKTIFSSKIDEGNTDKVNDIIESFIKSLFEKQVIVNCETFSKKRQSLQNTPIKDIHPRINGYKFHKRLYNSSKSAVSIFINKSTNKKVIIKAYYGKNNSITAEKIRHEVDILEKASKIDEVIRVLNYRLENDDEQKDNFVVLEYFNAKSLLSSIIRKKLNLIKKLMYFDIIIGAYSKLFLINILHGDIHPNNILIDTKNETLKLIDFGESILIPYTNDKNAGLSYFCPPERLNKTSFNKFKHPINPIGEVYQISLLLYFMLCGKIPFSGEKWSELSKSIRDWEFQPIKIKGLGKLVSNEINNFLRIGLNRDLKIRFENATEMTTYWKQIYQKQS